MIMLKPCRKCIVRPRCSEVCKPYIKWTDSFYPRLYRNIVILKRVFTDTPIVSMLVVCYLLVIAFYMFTIFGRN